MVARSRTLSRSDGSVRSSNGYIITTPAGNSPYDERLDFTIVEQCLSNMLKARLNPK